MLHWLPGRVRSCWDRRSCITEGLSYTNLLLAVCVRERKTGVCLCAWGLITQTNKQNCIQEGNFFLAEAPLPSALQGSFLD